MKSRIIVCIAAVTLALIVPVSGLQTPMLFETNAKQVYENSLLDPPEWATHMFKGVVGVTNINGKPEDPTHFIIGYCQEDFQGRFIGGFVNRDTSEISGYIAGITSGLFLKGVISNEARDARTLVVGLGRTNQTHCYLRVMPFVGPTIYIYGTLETRGIE